MYYFCQACTCWPYFSNATVAIWQRVNKIFDVFGVFVVRRAKRKREPLKKRSYLLGSNFVCNVTQRKYFIINKSLIAKSIACYTQVTSYQQLLLCCEISMLNQRYGRLNGRLKNSGKGEKKINFFNKKNAYSSWRIYNFQLYVEVTYSTSTLFSAVNWRKKKNCKAGTDRSQVPVLLESYKTRLVIVQ